MKIMKRLLKFINVIICNLQLLIEFSLTKLDYEDIRQSVNFVIRFIT